MILGKEHSSNQTKTAMAGCLAALLLAGVAFATNVQVQDRRVTMAMAEQLLAKAHQETGVPLLVNDRILVQLNRFLGTPDGRDYMRNSLQRMERFRTMIEAKIERKHLPPELLAIPVVESGYRNIAQDETPMHGAGIWMVIVSTAKRLGLQVEPPLDERMIPAKETDAALKYLGILHAEFKDWWLAILGYNAGKVRVRKAIEATGSTNAWTLIDQGFENDSDYLATVIATILIMKNPETLD